MGYGFHAVAAWKPRVYAEERVGLLSQHTPNAKLPAYMTALLIIAATIAAIWVFAYYRFPAIVWTIAIAFGLVLLTAYSGYPRSMLAVLWIAFVIASLLDNPTPLRRLVIGKPLLNLFRRVLPHVSQTEQEALDAGTVWWDGDLFSGNPDWKKLLAYPPPTLSAG